jgi:hypothetical protein
MSGYTDITGKKLLHRQRYQDILMAVLLQVSAFFADISADMLPAALPLPPAALTTAQGLQIACNCSSLLVFRPFGGSVHRRETPDTLSHRMVVSDQLPA